MTPRHRSTQRRRVSFAVAAPRRRPVVLASVALLAAALVAAPQIASAQEPRVLRSVDVSLGGDGTITAVRSTVVADDGDGDVRTDVEDIAPADAELPIRVQTTYRTPTAAGSDLADLAGHDGPVTIDVTVQNTTVEPRLLSYASGGNGVSEYALVGSPLTVVGAVTLEGATRVITSEGSTNGVLGHLDGAQAVQWSAILAPPQLSATATFRLELDVDDFVVPQFDVAVQPGLVTDPSVDTLLTRSFAAAPNSSRTMQLATLATITAVNETLGDVGASLDEIRAALAASATSFGSNASSGLAAANTSLAQRLDLAVTSLHDASAEVGATIDVARANGVSSLDAALEEIRSVLGTADPGTASAPARSGAACATSADLAESTTLLGLLGAISTSLQAYSSSTETCRTEIVADLTSALGTEAERVDPNRCAATPSAVCLLSRARDGIAATAGVLDADAEELRTANDGVGAALDTALTSLGELAASVQGVGSSLAAVEGEVTAAGSAGEVAFGLVDDDLLALRQDLEAFQAATAATGELGTGLESIAVTAEAQLALVNGDDGLRGTLGEVLDLVCTPAEPDASADLAALLDQVAGLGVCPGGADDLTTQLDQIEDAWTGLVDLVGPEGALVADLTTLDDTVVALLAGVDEARAGLAEASATHVTATFTSLATDLRCLSRTVTTIAGTPQVTPQVAPGDVPGCDLAPGSTTFDQVTTEWEGVGSAFDAAQAQFGAYSTAVNAALSSSQASLDTTAGSLLARGTNATTSVSSSLAALVGGLRSTAENSSQTGTAQVEQIDGRAQAATGDAGGALRSELDAAGDLLQANLGATQTDLAGTRQDLGAALTRVLQALGTPTAADGSGGTGIIGSLGRNSATAGSSLSLITEAAGQTAAFQGRRTVDLRALDRAQEQFRQASVRELDITTAGLDESSSVVTVFTFHLSVG